MNMNTVLTIAIVVVVLAIPFTIGYKTAFSTRGKRWAGALISWFVFVGLAGLFAWALGTVIAKRRNGNRPRFATDL